MATAKRTPKRARNFRLDASKLRRARAILGTPNDTATIEAALDLVVLRDEVVAGIHEIAGTGGVEDIYAPEH
jgi:hypothetical protein